MKRCSKCKRELPEANFNKANWIKSGLRSDCKECYAETKRKHWELAGAGSVNRARYRQLKAEAKAGLRTCKRCNTQLPLDSDHFAKVGASWNSTCRPCDRARVREWAESNPERYAVNAYAGCARRYAAKRKRTPPWLSSEQREQIKQIYAQARTERLNGLDVHVDHIVPLVGETVSGLHVPWNLQIIPASDNCSKSNKWAA